MSNPIGSIIEPPNGNGGITPIVLDTGGSNETQHKTGDAGNEPEIIAGYESTDPDTVRIDAAQQRRRGRPRGSGARSRSTSGIGSTEAETPRSLVDLTTLLLSLHKVGAAVLNVEELALDRTEAKEMADAIKEVARHYPTTIDPKKLAIANLAIVMGGIYGTRIMAYHTRQSKTPARERIVSIDAKASAKTQHVNGKATTDEPQVPSQIWNQAAADFPGM